MVRIVGVRTLELGVVPQTQGASGQQGQPFGLQPTPQGAARREQGFTQHVIVLNWIGDVLQVAVIRLCDKAGDLLGDSSGDADVFTGRSTGEQFHLKPFLQE